MAATSTRRVLVYGGKGALGSVCVNLFKSHNWWVSSVDLALNDEANDNLIITNSTSLVAQESEVIDGLNKILTDGSKLDAIVCVAGGWAGGSAASADFIKNADLMIKQSLWSSLIASKVASKFLNPNGLLVLTGAKAALDPTPGMIGYGLAKAAVHHLVKSLSNEKGGLPKGSAALAILPITLDTPMNRKFMPKADYSTWTPLDYVGQLFYQWASDEASRPHTGALVQLITENSQTSLKIV